MAYEQTRALFYLFSIDYDPHNRDAVQQLLIEFAADQQMALENPGSIDIANRRRFYAAQILATLPNLDTIPANTALLANALRFRDVVEAYLRQGGTAKDVCDSNNNTLLTQLYHTHFLVRYWSYIDEEYELLQLQFSVTTDQTDRQRWAKRLIQLGVDVNSQTNYKTYGNCTPLHMAIICDDRLVLRHLLSRRDINPNKLCTELQPTLSHMRQQLVGTPKFDGLSPLMLSLFLSNEFAFTHLVQHTKTKLPTSLGGFPQLETILHFKVALTQTLAKDVLFNHIDELPRSQLTKAKKMALKSDIEECEIANLIASKSYATKYPGFILDKDDWDEKNDQQQQAVASVFNAIDDELGCKMFWQYVCSQSDNGYGYHDGPEFMQMVPLADDEFSGTIGHCNPRHKRSSDEFPIIREATALMSILQQLNRSPGLNSLFAYWDSQQAVVTTPGYQQACLTSAFFLLKCYGVTMLQQQVVQTQPPAAFTQALLSLLNAVDRHFVEKQRLLPSTQDLANAFDTTRTTPGARSCVTITGVPARKLHIADIAAVTKHLSTNGVLDQQSGLAKRINSSTYSYQVNLLDGTRIEYKYAPIYGHLGGFYLMGHKDSGKYCHIAEELAAITQASPDKERACSRYLYQQQ